MNTLEKIREAIEAALYEARADDLAMEELEKHVSSHLKRHAPATILSRFTVADALNFTGWNAFGSHEGAPFELAA